MLRTPTFYQSTVVPGLGRLSVSRRLVQFTWDFALLLAVMGLYFIGRGFAPTRISDSVALTLRLIDIEQALGVYIEPAVQQFSIKHHFIQEIANAVYAYLHFPVMAAVAVWLWWRGRERFVFIRNVTFVSMAIGMLFYYLLPAAPPRLMALNGYELGFVDTVFGGNTAVAYAHPSLITNEYAAIPSFHFGWIALAAAAIWINSDRRLMRALAVGLVALMSWAIVASANHLLIDMALGGAVIALSWYLAAQLRPVAVRMDAASAGRSHE